MAVHLQRPIEIVKRSGWQYPFTFWIGLPPTSVLDDLDGYSAVVSLVPEDTPDAFPITMSTDDGTIGISGGAVTTLVGRGINAYWPEGDYSLLLRVFRSIDLVDRYVVRSIPNLSPVKVVQPAGGLTPIPSGSAIALPLAFSQGYAPNEILPGYPLLDMVSVSGGVSKFSALNRPTATVSFGIRKNGVIVGTAIMDPLTCGSGPVLNGTVTLFAEPTVFNPGDYLDWIAPSSVDATFRSAGLTLGGN